MTPRWWIAAGERGVTALGLTSGVRYESTEQRESPKARRYRAAAAKELRRYLAGRLREFSVPYDIDGLTPFARTVLRAAARIPYGETRSYSWLARRVGRPRAARAVGNALARNPLPIIIPCHRVLRMDGSFSAFVLGSEWKGKLLRLEKSRAKTKASNRRARR